LTGAGIAIGGGRRMAAKLRGSKAWRAGAAQSHPRRSRLPLEVAVALAVKFVALIVIWSVWFDDRQDRRVDGDDVARTIYSAPAAREADRTEHAARP
jgi:hypothetical protein